jgi:hypothetical protein
MTPRQVLGDGAAPIASMRAELFIAEFVDHQPAPQVAKAEQSPLVRSRLREGVSWQAWRDDIERVRRVPAMRGGVSEQRYQLVKAEEGIGIAVRQNVRQNEWQGRGAATFFRESGAR